MRRGQTGSRAAHRRSRRRPQTEPDDRRRHRRRNGPVRLPVAVVRQRRIRPQTGKLLSAVAQRVHTAAPRPPDSLCSRFFLFCFLLPPAQAVVDTSVVIENHTNTSIPVKVCHLNTPCGWAIYIPFIRRIDYFMKNT